MNKNIAFIGKKSLAILLKNFGIDTYIAENENSFLTQLKSLTKSNKYLLILTEEGFSHSVKDFLSKQTAPLPVIMMLPTVEVSGETIKMIGDMVERAVGVNILSKSES